MTSAQRFERIVHIARARCDDAEPAHDWLHVGRVVANARRILTTHAADTEVVVLAATLHELFNLPKGHPDSRRSGELCAERAREVMLAEGYDVRTTDAVAYAIAVHPFSLGVVPTTLEAKILQDADRLDAIGAIGIARCFASCADMKRPFYGDDDPFCDARDPDDKRWGIDHFYKKLLKIPEVLHTDAARTMADARIATMRTYLDALRSEITG